jgi:hypothetical protein
MTQKKNPTAADLLKLARDEGYRYPKVVGGVLCAVQPFAATYGLIVGIDPDDLGRGYERRYCYEAMADAIAALDAYEDTDKHPTGPWLKLKGDYNGKAIDLLNPEVFSIAMNGIPVRNIPPSEPVTVADMITGKTTREFNARMDELEAKA